jgi:hypothetical protein
MEALLMADAVLVKQVMLSCPYQHKVIGIDAAAIFTKVMQTIAIRNRPVNPFPGKTVSIHALRAGGIRLNLTIAI